MRQALQPLQFPRTVGAMRLPNYRLVSAVLWSSGWTIPVIAS
jgi:hypothetical protein